MERSHADARGLSETLTQSTNVTTAPAPHEPATSPFPTSLADSPAGPAVGAAPRLPLQSPAPVPATRGEITPSSSTDSSSLRRHGYATLPAPGQNQRVVDSCTCTNCKFLLRDPVQASGCGHRFCRLCAEEIIARGAAQSLCPDDGEPIAAEQLFDDRYAAKETLAIEVYCTSKQYADGDQGWCNWCGPLREFIVHADHCNFIRIACTACGEMVERRSLMEHKSQTCSQRQVKCPHCNAEMISKELKKHQDKSCPEMLVACPNHCTAEPMPRKSLDAHSKVCPMQVVNCYYNSSGCEYKGARRDLRAHHDNSLQFHLQLVDKMCHDLRSRLADSRSSSATGRVKHLETKVAELTRCLDEQRSLSQSLSNQLRAAQSERDDTLHSLRQLQTDFSAAMTRLASLEERMNRTQGIATAASNTSEPSSSSVQQRDPDTDGLAARVGRVDRAVSLHEVLLSDITMRQDINEVRMTTGTMVWKIADIRRRMREALSGTTPSLYSPPFYTSQCGYKMCLRIYLNGDGSGFNSHISLFFAIMRGDFDSLLRWPFQQKVTLMLLSQAPYGSELARSHIIETFKPDVTSSSFHRPDAEMNVATGCPKFARLSELSGTNRFIKDDSLFIKVVVDVQRFTAPDAPQIA